MLSHPLWMVLRLYENLSMYVRTVIIDVLERGKIAVWVLYAPT